MRGTIRKYIKKDGTVTWGYLVYTGTDENGKKKYKRKRGLKSQHECETALAAYITEIERGTVVDNDKMSVKEYLEYWLKTYPKNHCQPSTYKRYQIFCRDIIHSLGSYKLTKLNPLLIQKFYEDLKNGTIKEDLKKEKIFELQNSYDKLLKTTAENSREAKTLKNKLDRVKQQPVKGVSNNTIIKTHRMFHEALKQAQKWQLVYVNQCDLVTPPPADEIVMKYWDPEDIKTYLNELKDEFLYPIILTAVHTGLRDGELCGLRWNDVDLINKTITISSTLQRIDGVLQLKKPKTKKSSRVVTLYDSTIKLLKAMKNADKTQKLERGIELNYVFHWDDTVTIEGQTVFRPIDPHYVSEQFPKILATHKNKDGKQIIPSIRFHDLRHTHATLLRMLKVDAKVISERLGHADVAFTLKTYTHVDTNMQREEVSKAEEYL